MSSLSLSRNSSCRCHLVLCHHLISWSTHIASTCLSVSEADVSFFDHTSSPDVGAVRVCPHLNVQFLEDVLILWSCKLQQTLVNREEQTETGTNRGMEWKGKEKNKR